MLPTPTPSIIRSYPATRMILNKFALHYDSTKMGAVIPGNYDACAQALINDYITNTGSGSGYLKKLELIIGNSALSVSRKQEFTEKIYNAHGIQGSGVIVSQVSTEIATIEEIRNIVNYRSVADIVVNVSGSSRDVTEPNVDTTKILVAGSNICGDEMNLAFVTLPNAQLDHNTNTMQSKRRNRTYTSIPSIHFVAYYELIDEAGTIIVKIPYIAIAMSSFESQLLIDGVCAIKFFPELFSLFASAYLMAFASSAYGYSRIVLVSLPGGRNSYKIAGFKEPSQFSIDTEKLLSSLAQGYFKGTHSRERVPGSGLNDRTSIMQRFNIPLLSTRLKPPLKRASLVKQTARRVDRLFGPTPFFLNPHHASTKKKFKSKMATIRNKRNDQMPIFPGKKHGDRVIVSKSDGVNYSGYIDYVDTSNVPYKYVVQLDNAERITVGDGMDAISMVPEHIGMDGKAITKRKNPKNKSKKRRQRQNPRK